MQPAYAESCSGSFLLLSYLSLFSLFCLPGCLGNSSWFLKSLYNSSHYTIGGALLSLNRHSYLLLPASFTLPVAYCSVYFYPGAFSLLSYWCEVFFILCSTWKFSWGISWFPEAVTIFIYDCNNLRSTLDNPLKGHYA